MANRGSNDGADSLYSSSRRAAYRSARNKGLDHHEAEDIAQDTATKIWSMEESGALEADKALGLAALVGRNKAIDVKRQRRDLPVESLPPSPSEESPGDDRHIARLRGADVWSAAALSDDQARVLHLRYFEDRTFAEIGRLLDKPAGTIRMIHARALHSLRRQLNGVRF